MKRLMLIALFTTTSLFAQDYDCSNDSAKIHFKLDQKTLSGSLMTNLGTHLANSVSFTGTQDPATSNAYDLLDAQGSHGKLSIVHASNYHRSGLMGTNTSVSFGYLGGTIKFYDCTVLSDLEPVPDYHQCGRAGCFPCHTRACDTQGL